MRIKSMICTAQDPAAAEGAGEPAGGDAAGVGAAAAGRPPLVRLRQAAALGPQRQPRGAASDLQGSRIPAHDVQESVHPQAVSAALSTMELANKHCLKGTIDDSYQWDGGCVVGSLQSRAATDLAPACRSRC